MNGPYGFERECAAKLGEDIFTMISAVFELLPLGHIISNKVLVVHGGLSSDTNLTIANLQNLNRVCQPPESGVMNDILWSDPKDSFGISPSPRGDTVLFGPDITRQFLERNNLELLMRSHQVVDAGYSVDHDGKCVTVFSAPNYVGKVGNKGAFAIVKFGDDGGLLPLEFCQYEAQKVPDLFKPMIFTDFAGLFQN
jgi:serine/threonine-protein phosphatase 5